MTDTERRRLKFWVFRWIGAWIGIGAGVVSGLWTAHPTIGGIVGAPAGYFLGVSIMAFLERWWGIRAFKDNRPGWEVVGMTTFTPRQQDLVRRFYVELSS
jgi:hypothetical protein